MLAQAAVKGDREALTTLLLFYGPRLRERIKINPIRKRLDVDDIFQETHKKAYLHVQKRFKSCGPGSFERWLGEIADNCAKDAMRYHRRRRRDIRRDVDPSAFRSHGSVIDVLGQIRDLGRTPSRLAASVEAIELLRSTMARISDK